MEMSRFPNSLKKYRMKAGLKQYEVAELLELSHSGNISRWEKGFVLPSLIHLIEFIQLYDATPQELYPEICEMISIDIASKKERLEYKKFNNKLTNIQNLNNALE